MIKIEEISGIGEFVEKKHGEKGEDRVFEVVATGEKDISETADEKGLVRGRAFLVLRPKTLEVRCDGKLSKVLRDKYETVMESRFFGRGGVEIVPSGQLDDGELEDLIRLSYNMTKERQKEK